MLFLRFLTFISSSKLLLFPIKIALSKTLVEKEYFSRNYFILKFLIPSRYITDI